MPVKKDPTVPSSTAAEKSDVVESKPPVIAQFGSKPKEPSQDERGSGISVLVEDRFGYFQKPGT